MMTSAAQWGFYALIAAWIISELWLGRKRRSKDTTRASDRNTLRILYFTVCICIAAAVYCSFQPTGHWSHPPRVITWIGAASMLLGLALRFWSVRVLAQFFTVDVTIRENHQLIRHGPYAQLRHPSYTGSLLTFLGFALILGNTISLLLLMIPVTMAFLYRIHVEEAALAAAFPTQYPAYAKQTWRLIPFLW